MVKSKSPSRLVVRKRKILLLKIASYLAIFLVFFVCIVLFFRWGKTNIQNVTVEGNSAVTSEELVSLADDVAGGNYFWIFPKKNFLIYPKNEIKNNILDKFKRIEHVDISISGTQSVFIKVGERKPYGVWCSVKSEKDCYFLDKTGYIFDRSPDFFGDAYFKYYGGEPDTKDPIGVVFLTGTTGSFMEVNRFIDSLQSLDMKPYKFLYKNDGVYELYLKGNNGKLIFNNTQDLVVVFENLKIVFNTYKIDLNFEYIDLRFGNKIFYK